MNYVQENHDRNPPLLLLISYALCLGSVATIVFLGCGDKNQSANTKPFVEITYPIDQAIFNEDDEITFASMGGDEEDGSLSDNSFVWISSIDGRIGEGQSITRDSLSAGVHIIRLRVTDSENATGSDSVTIQIKTTTTAHPISIGKKTIGVINPENAFDGNKSTAAKIARYWGEAVHSDYLHLVAFIGKDDRFTFKISTLALPHSTLIIEGETSSGQWKEIYRYRLDIAVAKIITITNAQDYADENSRISLRILWIGEKKSNGAHIFEISRKLSPTRSTNLASRVIIIDL